MSCPPSFSPLCCWLYLARLRLPAACWAQIREAGWSLEALFSLDRAGYAERGIPKALHSLLAARDEQRLADDLAWLEASPTHHVVTWADEDYPPLLRHIPDPPPLLFACGQRRCLRHAQFAIVGSRRPDAYGTRMAAGLASRLSAQGWTITSGLALGVDYQAHRSALDAGGWTIAVLGNGLASVYPRRHRAIAAEIAENGLLLSEFPPKARPLPAHFPRRNRIISGMSVAVLVVQATRRSGSLITARQAAEQGRDVFAVPGSVRNPLSEGCHALIRQGAKLVERSEDIVEELPDWALPARPRSRPLPSPPPAMIHHPPHHHKALQELLQQMGCEPISVDELVEATGLTSETVSAMLLLLEISGSVVAEPGGRYLRV